ncbi:MAG: RdgB/HAM1 family non-canonical purine NTP pyrophosphatase [Bacteroidales bacterium]|jgi:XTP/dITP diphosphohydrolase|nr:RdgB/HAM1 family non-canonical purine NTP pyrophosphatase [Bacteroidales bacterium]
MKIIVASNNQHKIREISAVLNSSVTLVTMAEAGITEDIPENESSLEGNALEKARYVYRLTGKNVFADDTGLETEALNGAPGVHSARYAGPGKDSDANIRKLLTELQGHENRRARFRTVIALILNTKEYLFEGIINGRIINEKRGRQGFGYDPVFIPENEKLTFAEMPSARKNQISHRAIAIKKLSDFLQGAL